MSRSDWLLSYVRPVDAAWRSPLELLDEAEGLDPFLPVWCIEERVAALYARGRFEEAAAVGRALPFQTRRSRLYRAASHVALGNLDRARQIVAEARAAAPT